MKEPFPKHEWIAKDFVRVGVVGTRWTCKNCDMFTSEDPATRRDLDYGSLSCGLLQVRQVMLS